ncbi:MULTISPECIES: 2OG-Fe(II) oxygenase [unclassified Solwaraspora]|uniref:2OG-Fe(II) oxygenase n=1 Tax=unclassified Solwaraspora TaxID=2627926 RepID=UPI00259B7C93|nr:2OG-Fe(II) oxygenase [Solwaraspora sp. WMMA2056]WJK40494.1 2OG-Fe(II) oxygenase [Solwaraspora sp. WMMA2056]
METAVILDSPTLDTATLDALTSGAALIARVRGYTPAQVCADVVPALLDHLDRAAGTTSRIYRSNVGTFSEAQKDAEALAHYRSRAADTLRAVRASCAPYASPVDRLRCELDESWPAGSQLLRHGGTPLVFGMLRVWQDGAHALPHMDILARAAPRVPGAHRFTGQLGVNLFLQAPAGQDDGLLQLWDVDPYTVDRTDHGVAGTYGYRRDLLGEPAVSLAPRTGDLVLLRSDRVHAVTPTHHGRRVTLSGFIGYADPADPLRLWS